MFFKSVGACGLGLQPHGMQDTGTSVPPTSGLDLSIHALQMEGFSKGWL